MFVHDNLLKIEVFRKNLNYQRSKALDIQPNHHQQQLLQEDICDYVAQLQLHMALQARNLVPTFNSANTDNSRHQMLQEAQAVVEKMASRQSF